MASGDTLKEQIAKKAEELLRQQQETLEEQNRAFEEQQASIESQPQFEDTASGSDDTGESSGGSGDARSHDSEELEALETVAEAIQGEPQNFLQDAVEEVLEGEDIDPHHVHVHDVFNGASGCHATNRERLQKKLDTSGNTSFHTSYNKEDDDEAKQALKNFQNYVAVKSAMDYTQRAMEATQAYIDNLYSQREELDQQIAEKDSEIEQLEQEAADQDVVVEQSVAAVEGAQIEVNKTGEALQDATERREGSQMGFDASAKELAMSENQTGIVYDGGYLDDVPKMYIQNEDGSWTQLTEDASGNVVQTTISEEEAAKFQSSEFTTDMYLRGVAVDNGDGTTSIALRDSSVLNTTEPLTADQQKLLDAYTEITGRDEADLVVSSETVDSSMNKVIGSNMDTELVEKEYTEAQKAHDEAKANLEERQAQLEQERAKLQEKLDNLDLAKEERQALLDKRAALDTKIEQAEEFQQKLENNEFENEEAIIEAMPEELQKDYIANYNPDYTPSYTTDFLDGQTQQQMYASTSPTQPTATSYASEVYGENPNDLTAQVAFNDSADPNQPAPANEPAPEDPTYNPATQPQQSFTV